MFFQFQPFASLLITKRTKINLDWTKLVRSSIGCRPEVGIKALSPSESVLVLARPLTWPEQNDHFPPSPQPGCHSGQPGYGAPGGEDKYI